VDIQWDERKAAANLRKHGVSFEEAATVLRDPIAFTFTDPGHYAEVRDITIGWSVLRKLLVVVHTSRAGNAIRIISARQATRKERKQYEEGI
jgi:uncharacterized DUF497 family protein